MHLPYLYLVKQIEPLPISRLTVHLRLNKERKLWVHTIDKDALD